MTAVAESMLYDVLIKTLQIQMVLESNSNPAWGACCASPDPFKLISLAFTV